MTELCEPVAIGEAAAKKTKPCWYCKQEGPEIDNDEDAEPQTNDGEDEDAVPENDEKNCATKLGVQLTKGKKKQPTWKIICPLDKKRKPTVLSAAHHLIPGNASLKKASDQGLKHFMRKNLKFNHKSDIGYNVNHRSNGVWLPGNYGVRKGRDGYKQNWGKIDNDDFKNEYAARAMKMASGQFHDAHPDYSTNVLDSLKVLKSKMKDPKTKCPICDDDLKATVPPYGLVGRLDFMSGVHRGLITNLSPKKGKKAVMNNYFTSSRVKTYFGL